jgi:hypothetical protein
MLRVFGIALLIFVMIGILIVIVLPRFEIGARFLERFDMGPRALEWSREGATKGNLSSIRSSISIYYSEIGVFPDDIITSFSSYLYPIPPAKATPLGNSNKVALVKTLPNGNDIGWAYVTDKKSIYYGNIYPNSIGTDTRGRSFTTY